MYNSVNRIQKQGCLAGKQNLTDYHGPLGLPEEASILKSKIRETLLPKKKNFLVQNKQ